MRNTQISPNSDVYTFNGFVLDANSGELFHHGKEVRLAPKVADCLVYLVLNNERLVAKGELIGEVWQDAFVEDNALSYSISQLRKALAAFDPETEFIKTVPRRGFRFLPEVSSVKPGVVHPFANRADDLRQKTINLEHPADTAKSGSHSIHAVDDLKQNAGRTAFSRNGARSITAIVALGLSVFMLAGFAVWKFGFSSPSGNINSIAVLPFRSFSESHSDSELRLRIADAVITRLGNLSHVVVRPTNAIVKFSDSSEDAIEIGRRLNVDAVLDGRLQGENGKIRATVQLISVKTGDHLWSTKFDGTSDRLIALQDQIAEGLLARLIELRPQERDTHLIALSTRNSDAYDNYLRGRYFFDQRNTNFDESLKKTNEYFSKALEIDPEFLSATAELANVINLQTSSGQFKRDVGYPRARELAFKALERKKDLPEAHIALGWVYQKFDYNFHEAERSFKQAISLNPNYLLAHLWLNINYSLQGKFEESKYHIDRALAIDPASASAHAEMMSYLIRKGECENALAHMPKVLEFNNDPTLRSMSQGEYEAVCRRFDSAIPLLESAAAELEARGVKPARVYVVLGYAYAASGNREKALEVAERLEQMKGKRNVHSGLVATYAHLGETENFHRALEELWESGDERILQMKFDPRYEIVRTDPKFEEILRRINLL